VGRAAEVEAQKDHDIPGAVLVPSLGQCDSGSPNVQVEILAAIL
jgi:hypothetical protein